MQPYRTPPAVCSLRSQKHSPAAGATTAHSNSDLARAGRFPSRSESRDGRSRGSSSLASRQPPRSVEMGPTWQKDASNERDLSMRGEGSCRFTPSAVFWPCEFSRTGQATTPRRRGRRHSTGEQTPGVLVREPGITHAARISWRECMPSPSPGLCGQGSTRRHWPHRPSRDGPVATRGFAQALHCMPLHRLCSPSTPSARTRGTHGGRTGTC